MTVKTHKVVGYVLFGIFLAATVTAVSSCGSDDKKKEETPTTTTTLKYTDVSATINASCVTSGCHNTKIAAQGNYDMRTRAGIAEKAALAASRIEAGTMPTGTYKTQLDGSPTAKANLIQWLKAGAPQ